MVKPKKGYSFEWTSKGGNNISSIAANCHIYNFKHPADSEGKRREDMVIIDMGSGSGDYGARGFHRILADIEEELKIADKIVLTHAHADHMEAIFYYLMSPFMTARGGLEMGHELPPIFGTPYTITKTKQYLTIRLARLMASKDMPEAIKTDMKERFEKAMGNMHVFYPGQSIRVGKEMHVKAIPVSHSTLHSVALLIQTPTGTVFHSGDFNTDQTYSKPCRTDFNELGSIGEDGVDVAMIDSTGADKKQSGIKEEKVRDNLKEIIEQHPDKRAVITVMGGHDQRLFSLIDVARETGREIQVAGKAMQLTFDIFRDMGLLPHDVKIHYIKRAGQENNLDPSKAILISTGSQGERRTPLVRALLENNYKTITLKKDKDIVIFSSSLLGINRARYSPVLNALGQKGIRHYHQNNHNKALNASGHARSPGIKRVLRALKPTYGFPVHGMLEGRDEGRPKGLLYYCADVMDEEGIKPVIAKNGQTFRLDHPDGPKLIKDKSREHSWLGIHVFANQQNWTELYLITRHRPSNDNEKEKKDRFNIGRSFDHTI